MSAREGGCQLATRQRNNLKTTVIMVISQKNTGYFQTDGPHSSKIR